MSRDVFFNFPIELMRASPDMRQFGGDVIHYCIFKHSLTLDGNKAVEAAAKFYGVQLASTASCEQNGRKLYLGIDLPAPMTGISKDMLFDFYDNYKTEHEIAVLMAFLAIKSILGKKSYCRVTNEYLLCRMAGYGSQNDMTELPEWLRRYQSRRAMHTLKIELQRVYGLKLYARFTRGFFVSFTMSLEELVKAVELKRKSNYEENLKAETFAAVMKTINELYPNGKDQSKS